MHSAVLLSLFFKIRGVSCRYFVSLLFQMSQSVDVPLVLLKSLPCAIARLSLSPSVVSLCQKSLVYQTQCKVTNNIITLFVFLHLLIHLT